MSNISLYFLGTASAFPTPDRGVSCIGLKHQHGNWLFDCGEGSQIQLQKVNFKPGKVTKIFITHLHGDHLFGLPGLLCTLGLSCPDETRHIDIYGPSGLRVFVRNALSISESFLAYTYSVHELILSNSSRESKNQNPALLHANEKPGTDIIPDSSGRFALCKESTISACAYEIQHRVPCVGYVIEEDRIPGRLNATLLREKGLQPGPSYGDLKRGMPVTLPSGEVILPKDVLEPERTGRKLVILGDTCNSDSLINAGLYADAVIHEATYENSMILKAIEHGHSTAGMAGTYAQCLKAKKLILTHFSQRYRSLKSRVDVDDPSVSILVEEAKAEFDGEVIAAEDLMIVDIPLGR